MKRLLLFSVCIILWALSTSVKALPGASDTVTEGAADERGFSHRVVGKATLADGETLDIDMLIGFQESSRGWYFRAGSDYVFRNTPPKAYYLNLNLDGKGYAYVIEFSQQPLKHFEVQLEGYEIELMQASGADIEYGMRLRINDRQFLFDSRHPRVRIDLSEAGLTGVFAEHTLRDLSIRRAQ